MKKPGFVLVHGYSGSPRDLAPLADFLAWKTEGIENLSVMNFHSLREKLRVDFSLDLPSLDENTEPESYFSEVREMISEKQPRWRLRRCGHDVGRSADRDCVVPSGSWN